MNKTDFAKAVMAIKAYYPKENILDNNYATELWYKQLADIPYEVFQAVIMKWVAAEKWSPTIADIRRMAAEIMLGEIPDWGTAWQEVIRAMGACGRNYPQEAYKMMGELTRDAVSRLGWTKLCESENPAANRANFRDIYNELAEKARRERQIPEKFRLLIEQSKVKHLEGGKNNGTDTDV